MALYHFHAGFISRSSTMSVTSHVAYIGGKTLKSERNDITYCFKNKPDVAKNFIILPKEAPAWAKDSQKLWNRVELFEDKVAHERFRASQKDPEQRARSLKARQAYLETTQTAQKFTLALQKELTLDQNEAVLRDFIVAHFASRGLATEAAIHSEEGNPHAHLVVTRRPFEGNTFAHKKDRDIVTKQSLLALRHSWVDHVNRAFEAHKINAHVFAESYATLGIKKNPTHHEGWYARHMEAQGKTSRIVSENKIVHRENLERLFTHPECFLKEMVHKKVVFTRDDIKTEFFKQTQGNPELFAAIMERFDHRDQALNPAKSFTLSAEAHMGIERGAEKLAEGAEHPTTDSLDKPKGEILNRYADHVLENPEAVPLGKNIHGAAIFTSKTWKKREENILARADQLYKRQSSVVSEDILNAKISEHEHRAFSFSATQKQALSHINSPKSLSLLIGNAGSGKTTLLKPFVAAATHEGHRILGMAFQGKVAELLTQELGIQAHTIDVFKKRWTDYDALTQNIDSKSIFGKALTYAHQRLQKLDPWQLTQKDIVILDEANMVGAHLWEPLFKKVLTSGAKLIVIQDPHQLKGFGVGDIGRLLLEKYDSSTLQDVFRQHHTWQQEASKHLNQHDLWRGLKPYEERGYVVHKLDRTMAMDALVRDYMAARQVDPMQHPLVLAFRKVSVAELNQKIRQGLVEKNMLSHSKEINGTTWAVGDRLLFTRNDPVC